MSLKKRAQENTGITAGLIGAILIAGLIGVLKANFDSDDAGQEEEAAEAAVEVAGALDGVAVVTLSPEALDQGGMSLVAIEAGAHAREFSAFGRVLDITPLLALRRDHDEAFSMMAVAGAELEVSRAEHARLSLLNKKDRNVSAKVVQQANATLKGDRARFTSAQSAAQASEGELRQNWGAGILDLIRKDQGAGLGPLIDGEMVLLRVVVPPGEEIPDRPDHISIHDGGDGRALAAEFLSVVPAGDPLLHGAAYLFQTPASALRPGSGLGVWVRSGAVKEGVIIPEAAIVWYAGKAWTYVLKAVEVAPMEEGEEGEEGMEEEDAMPATFVRRLVPENARTAQGWFVEKGFLPGEVLVANGGEMLLSEELRWQIQGDDDD